MVTTHSTNPTSYFLASWRTETTTWKLCTDSPKIIELGFYSSKRREARLSARQDDTFETVTTLLKLQSPAQNKCHTQKNQSSCPWKHAPGTLWLVSLGIREKRAGNLVCSQQPQSGKGLAPAAHGGKPWPPRRPEPQHNPGRRPHYPATTPARAGAVGAGPTRAPEAPPPWRSRGGRQWLSAQRAPRSGLRGLPATAAAPSAPRPAPPPPSSPVLQIHLQDLPVALKEALHIALPGLVAQAADVHARHPGGGGGWPRPPSGGGRRRESAAAAAAAVTGGRRDGRSRSPATYASTQLESARPCSPLPLRAERNGRERAPASRPARAGGRAFLGGAPARGGA